MEYYYVYKNVQPNGDHEVHIKGCNFLPASENRIPLGQFYSCDNAIIEATKYYNQVNGCYYCCQACHIG